MTSFWRRGEETQATLGAAKEIIYDLDVLLRITGMDGRSQTVLGVSGREGQVVAAGLFSDTAAGSTLYAYTRSDSEIRREQHQRRAYASEQLSLTDQVSLALAGSFENSDTGGQQPAYQGAIIYKPMDETTLRVSGSKSPTMPSLLNKYARLELITGVSFPYPGPFPPSFIPRLNAVRVEGTNITAPQIASYEVTLSQSLLERRFTAQVKPLPINLLVFQPPLNSAAYREVKVLWKEKPSQAFARGAPLTKDHPTHTQGN
jgi:hypothetical protein